MAIGQLHDRRLRHRHRSVHVGRLAERQDIACGQRAPAESAHRADEMRRAAAERRRHCNAAGDGHVSARADAPRAESQPRAGRDDERRVRRHGAAVERQIELRAGHCHHALVVELELGTEQRDLEAGGALRVANQRVSEPMRHRIHRSAHRHAARLQTPSPRVLHRRQHARFDHDDAGSARGEVRRHAGASRSYSARSIV